MRSWNIADKFAHPITPPTKVLWVLFLSHRSTLAYSLEDFMLHLFIFRWLQVYLRFSLFFSKMLIFMQIKQVKILYFIESLFLFILGRFISPPITTRKHSKFSEGFLSAHLASELVHHFKFLKYVILEMQKSQVLAYIWRYVASLFQESRFSIYRLAVLNPFWVLLKYFFFFF